MSPRLPALVIALALAGSCFPTTRQETGLVCWSLVNGDAESQALEGWTAQPPDAVAAVSSQDQTSGVVTPQHGEGFFSFARQPAQQVSLTHSCSPAPVAKACTLSGWVRTEHLGTPGDQASAAVRYLDDAGTLMDETASEAHAPTSGDWQHFELRAEIPQGAGEIQVVLEGIGVDGERVNVFWDDLSLSCSDGVSGAS